MLKRFFFKLPDEFSVLPFKNTVDDEKTPGQRGGNQKRTIILSASQQNFGPSCFNRALKD